MQVSEPQERNDWEFRFGRFIGFFLTFCARKEKEIDDVCKDKRLANIWLEVFNSCQSISFRRLKCDINLWFRLTFLNEIIFDFQKLIRSSDTYLACLFSFLCFFFFWLVFLFFSDFFFRTLVFIICGFLLIDILSLSVKIDITASAFYIERKERSHGHEVHWHGAIENDFKNHR